MQRFHDTLTQNAATTPVYDSETVRDVLARAAQIEQRTQTDAPMTAEQIETLGLAGKSAPFTNESRLRGVGRTCVGRRIERSCGILPREGGIRS